VIRLSGSVSVTATGETPIYDVPGSYIAYLRRLAIANRAASPANVRIVFYNGDTPKTVLSITVAAGGTSILAEDELPEEACPTRIAVVTDQQPIDVSYTVELA